MPIQRSSFRAQERIAQYEQSGEDPDQRTHLTRLAAAEFHEGKGQHAQAKTCGNAERQRHGHKRQERRKGFAEIVPADARDGSAHQNSHEHERRSCCISWNRGDHWGTKHSQEKQYRDNHVAETRTRTGRDPGRALDVTRTCRSARESAKHRPNGVSHQSPAGAWKFPISQKPARFANTDERPNVVKQIHKEKHEDEFAESDFSRRSQIELQKSAGRMWQRKEFSRPMIEPERNARESDQHNSQENGATEPSSHENGD